MTITSTHEMACRGCRGCGKPGRATPINGPACDDCLWKCPDAFGYETGVRLKMHVDARRPEIAKEDDACFDLFASEAHRIEPGRRAKVACGFDIQLKQGWEAQVRPRSGRSLQGIDVTFGTVDAGYRGTMSATLVNNTGVVQHVAVGDKVAQMAVRRAPRVALIDAEQLDPSERGAAGFGSTDEPRAGALPHDHAGPSGTRHGGARENCSECNCCCLGLEGNLRCSWCRSR